VQTPLDVRANITYNEYVILSLREYELLYHEGGLHKWAENVKAELERIHKGNENAVLAFINQW